MLIIWCKFFFLFIDRKPTTWPANNCLQIMVCSCAMSSYCVWLQNINNVLLMRKQNHAFLLLVITLPWKMADHIASQRYSLKTKPGHQMIKHNELGYHKISWFVSVSLADQLLLICSPLTNHNLLLTLI